MTEEETVPERVLERLGVLDESVQGLTTELREQREASKREISEAQSASQQAQDAANTAADTAERVGTVAKVAIAGLALAILAMVLGAVFYVNDKVVGCKNGNRTRLELVATGDVRIIQSWQLLADLLGATDSPEQQAQNQALVEEMRTGLADTPLPVALRPRDCSIGGVLRPQTLTPR